MDKRVVVVVVLTVGVIVGVVGVGMEPHAEDLEVVVVEVVECWKRRLMSKIAKQKIDWIEIGARNSSNWKERRILIFFAIKFLKMRGILKNVLGTPPNFRNCSHCPNIHDAKTRRNASSDNRSSSASSTDCTLWPLPRVANNIGRCSEARHKSSRIPPLT